MSGAQQVPPYGQSVVATPLGNYPKGANWDGGGSLLTTAVKRVTCAPCQAAGTIISATAECVDFPGSCTVDVWNTSYAGAPASSANKISGAAPITLSSAIKSQDTTLGGWTVAVNKGDILVFIITSISSIDWLGVSVEIKPT